MAHMVIYPPSVICEYIIANTYFVVINTLKNPENNKIETNSRMALIPFFSITAKGYIYELGILEQFLGLLCISTT